MEKGKRRRKCGFLKLPPELRNIIYEIALSTDPDWYIDGIGIVDVGKRPKFGKNPATYSAQALLQTCKEIYVEAADVFYSINNMNIKNLKVKSFLNVMTPQRLQFTTCLAVNDPGKSIGRFKFLDHLTRLPRLQTLIIILSILIPADWYHALAPIRIIDLQRKIAALVRLQKVIVRISEMEVPGHLYWVYLDEDDEELGEAMQDVLSSAVVCGHVTRAIEQGWKTGSISFKKTDVVL